MTTWSRIRDALMVVLAILGINLIVLALCWCDFINKVMWDPRFEGTREKVKNEWWYPQWHRRQYPERYNDSRPKAS
jgi:hypothetical protein